MKRASFSNIMTLILSGIFLFLTFLPVAHGGEVVTFYHNDHLGSPLAMTDMDGNVVWRRDYKPFGEEIDPGGSTVTNTHTYTGKEYDSETGLYYYGKRYYDPTIGRFISVDPVGGNPYNPQSWNRYIYSYNNPYRYIDPNGETPWDVVDFVSFGLSLTAFAANPGWGTALDLTLDTVGLAPGVPGIGTMKRGMKLLNKVGDTSTTTPLFRAVGPDELADIKNTNQFTNPSGIENKYFTDSYEKARAYVNRAQDKYGDGPYTVIETSIPTSKISPDMDAGTVADIPGGLPTTTIPTNKLPDLSPPIIQD